MADVETQDIKVDNKEKVVNPEAAPVADKVAEETPEQINWRKFRAQREADRRAKEESDRKAAETERAAKAIQEAMAAMAMNQAAAPQAYVANQAAPGIARDEIPTGGQVIDLVDKRIEDGIAKGLKEANERAEAERRAQEAAELPIKLKTVHGDFDQVCTAENIDYLEYHYPEVAAGFKHMPDGFEKWSNLYKAVKRFVNVNSEKDKATAMANYNKPKSISVPGITQTGDSPPTIISDQRRKDNWARMQRVMRGG